MKKFFNVCHKLMAFDTETQLLSELGNRMSDRVDYVFMVTEDGDFILDAESISVKTGELLAVLYGNNDGDNRKIAIYGSKEHIAHILEYVEICKKRSAERSSNACSCTCG